MSQVVAHLPLVLPKGHLLHGHQGPRPPGGTTIPELLPSILNYSKRAALFPLLQAQNIWLVTDFSSHFFFFCHLGLPTPAFPIPDVTSSSPLIRVLPWLIPSNSTRFSVFEFSCHLCVVWIRCLEIVSCFLCVSIRFKVLKAKIRISVFSHVRHPLNSYLQQTTLAPLPSLPNRGW